MRFLISAFVLILTCSILEARPKTYSAAVSILGQPDFTSAIESIPPTSRSFYQPDGVAIDPTTGKLFVADSDNNRILRFSSTAAYRNYSEAEAVFGQPDFVSFGVNRGQGAGNPSANSLHHPAAICVDSAGRLWVPDHENARVLRFDNASEKPSFTAAADAVIGQPNFTTSTQAANSTSDWGFARPSAVAVDANGNLWVSDYVLFRVLRFDAAATLGAAYDGSADGYLGAVSANAFVSGTTSSAFSGFVWGLSVGADGRLWVADGNNNRVLRFDDAANKADGAAADGVLGQPDFTTSTAAEPPTATGFEGPYGVTIAPDGTLWVGDYTNYRVLGFLDAANKGAGSPADLVLGQPDFVTQDLPPTYLAVSTTNPSQIAIGREGSLFIGEYSNAPHIKRWSDPVTITAPKSGRASASGSATLRGKASGATKVEYRVPGRGGFKAAKGTANAWSVRLAGLTRKSTVLTVRAVAFDDRTASAKVTLKKSR